MSKTPRSKCAALKVLVLAAIIAAAISPLPASAGSTALQGAEVIRVSVNFSSQTPLADLSDDTLASSQKSGRKFIYRMARDECAVLRAVIAKTCRLTGLSVNSQIRNQSHPGKVQLSINGSANFSITLKGEED